MDSKDLTDLYEAYLNVYENVEEIDEVTGGGHVNPFSGVYDSGNRSGLKSGMKTTPLERARAKERVVRGADPKRANRIKRGAKSMLEPELRYAKGVIKGRSDEAKRLRGMSEEYDNFDLVLEYLLDEGLCDTQENAEAMMAHMSEEWVESILEAKEDENLSGVEKIGKRNRRSGFTTRERRDDHRNMRG
jgi:hypothetical protein